MVDQAESGEADAPSIEAELNALRKENAALRAQLEAAPAKREERGGRARPIASWVLVVLAVIAVLAGAHAAWLQTTIADEDRFVDTLAPLPQEPAVAIVLSERIADELIVAADVATVIDSNLPQNLKFLAAPVTEGLRNLTADVAEGVISSDVFAGIWRQVLRLSHNAASLVLTTDGRVAIDLNEAADEVVTELEARGVTLLSDVEVELPEIVIFQNDQLETASGALELIDTMGWFLPVLALVLIGAAIWISTDRRRTTAAIGFGTAIAVLVMLVVARLARAGTVSAIDDETRRAAAEAAWDTTLRFYRQGLRTLVVLGLVVGFAAWIFSSSPRAIRARTWWQDMIERRRGPDATVPTSGFAGFLAQWQRQVQWGAVVLGLLFILIVPEASAWLVILTALVVLGIIAIVQIVGGPAPTEATADAAAVEAGARRSPEP